MGYEPKMHNEKGYEHKIFCRCMQDVAALTKMTAGQA